MGTYDSLENWGHGVRIAVVGLGKLGSVIAAVYSAAGHHVVGFDINRETVEQLNAGRAPVAEPGLQELVNQAGSRLRATSDIHEALEGAEASYVIVPTPSDQLGNFSNDYVISALTSVGEVLRESSIRHTVVICSTVMPGSCDGILAASLERSSGKKVGDDIGLVYSPEFIALGSVVRDMHNPDMILIGESDQTSGDLVARNALSVVKNDPDIQRMNLVNAELVKISVNTFVTAKISFANMLAEICDRLPGGDADVVTTAVGSDTRIGRKYLKAALGYGGPCFPRDNVALTRLADGLGVNAALPSASDTINERQVSRLVEIVQRNVEPGSTVAILGLAYKPDTSVCERSQGVEIANRLAASNFRVVAFDPQADLATAPEMANSVHLVDRLEDALALGDAIVIATAWAQFAELGHVSLAEKFVVDPWGVLPTKIPAIRPGKLMSALSQHPQESPDA